MLEVYKFDMFTAPCEVQLYTKDKMLAQNCAKDILYEMKRLEKKYNYFDKASFLSKLNSRETNELDNETKNLLSYSFQFYKKTNGIFDITIATIKDIFDINLKEKLFEYVGCEHIKIKKSKLYFDNDKTKIDFGGVVKEYGVDRAVKIVKKYKIKSALINFGGDIYALGKKPDGKQFTIGIKNPHNTNESLFFIPLENEALTTSASYERYKEIDGIKHSHIISKKLSNDKILSVTVVSKSALEAGIYSTSLMINQDIQTKNKTYIIDMNLDVLRS